MIMINMQIPQEINLSVIISMLKGTIICKSDHDKEVVSGCHKIYD